VFFGFHSQDIGFTIAGINIVNLFSGGMTSQQQAVVNQAIAIIDRVLGGWKTQDANFAAAGADIVNRFTDGVRAAAPNLQSVSQTVANGVHAAFAGVSLFGVGNSIMDSLANGLNAKRNFLQQVLSGITAMIPAGKGPPQKDRVLLKPAGESIMDGLIGAIVGKQAELQLALAGVTNTITSAFDPTASGFNPAISAQLGASLVNTTNLAATPVIVNVNTDTPALKDFISVQINDGNRDTRRRVLAGG